MEYSLKNVKHFVFLKLASLLIPSVVVLYSCKPDKLVILGIGIVLLFFCTYFRQYYFEKSNATIPVRLCIIVELLLTTLIVAVSKSNILALFYLVCIFEATAKYSPEFGAGITGLAMMCSLFLELIYNDSGNLLKILADFVSSIGIAMVFTYIVSYSLKIQMNERQRIARTNAELEEAYKKLMDNASKVQELSIEKERTRMAREIHDTLAHTLTAIVVQMEASRKLMDVDMEKAREELGKAQELTRSGLNDVKRTIKALRPQMLENKSFLGAVDSLVSDMAQSTGTQFEFSKNLPSELRLHSNMEVALFRVIQESITNSIRHGKAKSIRINLGCENNIIHLSIEDNGTGCSSIKKGFGLKGITERIESINGTVGFYGAAGAGFKTNIYIPLEGEGRLAN